MSANIMFSDTPPPLVYHNTDTALILGDQKEPCKTREIVAGFNYGQIENTILADHMRAAAGRVREHVRASVIEVGRELLAIKAQTRHGDFVAWVEAECRLLIRTAQRAMKAAEFVDRTKSVKLSFLPADGLLALASIPSQDVVDGIVQRIDRGEAITVREIKAACEQLRPYNRTIADRAERDGVAKEPTKGPSIQLAADAGSVREEPEVWLVARTDTIRDDTVRGSVVAGGHDETRDEPDLLVVAIHAVKNLSEDDLADFDRWYRDAYWIGQGRAAVEDDITARDGPEALMSPVERAPEQDGEHIGDEVAPLDDHEEVSTTTPVRVSEADLADAVEIEHDPIIAMWLDFKPNPQKCGRAWALAETPAEVSSSEHFRVTERLAPWRDAYRAAPPERQETIRRWLEQQRL
jgi:hypothetical protein